MTPETPAERKAVMRARIEAWEAKVCADFELGMLAIQLMTKMLLEDGPLTGPFEVVEPEAPDSRLLKSWLEDLLEDWPEPAEPDDWRLSANRKDARHEPEVAESMMKRGDGENR